MSRHEHDEAGELRRIIAERDAQIRILEAKLKLSEEHRKTCAVCSNCKSSPSGEPPDTVPGNVP